MNVLRRFFEFGKRGNGATAFVREDVIYIEQKGLITLNN